MSKNIIKEELLENVPEFKGVTIGNLSVSEETLKAIDNGELTFNMWIGISNEEIKSAFAEYLNQQGKLFDFFRDNLTEMDTFVNERQKGQYLEGTTGGSNIGVYTRFVGNINGADITYVRCYCPSTDRMSFLCTENKDNAKDSIASLCEIPLALKDEILEIYRQGEIFSFKLTEKGYDMIDKKKVNYDEKVYLTGDEYFDKMCYEY